MEEEKKDFIFSQKNYKLMIAGLAVIGVGFLLMAGGAAENDTAFSDQIFTAQRITIAPIVILAGFIIEIYAIMKR